MSPKRSSRSTRTAHFLGFRAKIIAAIGAYLQTGMPAFTGNLGTLAGVYRTPASHIEVTAVFTHTQPVRPYRGNGRPEAGYVIERMVDLAADQLGIDPAELRRRNTIPPSAMPFKTSVTFTYDCGEFEKNMDLALKAADWKGFEARRAARAQARQAARASVFPTRSSVRRRPASKAPRSGSTAPARYRCFPAASIRARATKPRSSRSSATGSASIPNEVTYIQGDTDQVFFAEGTGGSRSAAFSGSAFTLAADKVEAKAKAIAANMLKVEVGDIKFADGVFSSQKTNQTLTIKEVGQGLARAEEFAARHGAGPDREGDLYWTRRQLSQRRVTSASSKSTRRPAWSRSSATTWSTTSARSSIRCLLHGQVDGGIAMGVGQVLMEDIRFDEQGQILTGSFMDYAMPRASDLIGFHVESNPVPTKTNPLGVKGAGEAGSRRRACRRSPMRWSTRFRCSASSHIDLPATPERLWRAIHEARAKGA